MGTSGIPIVVSPTEPTWAKSDIHAVLLGLLTFLLTSWYMQERSASTSSSSGNKTAEKKTLNLPPGPFGWRIYTLIPDMIALGLGKGLYFHELLIHWGKPFENGIFVMGFGSDLRILVLNNFEALREAFKHPDLNGRAPNTMRDFLFRGKGLLFSSGELWKEHRKFTLAVLRSFGVGKKSFESEIAEESRYLIDKFRSTAAGGKPFDPTHLLCNAVGNVICSVTFGKRYDYDDETFIRMFHYVEFILEHQIQNAVMTEACPPLVRMPFGPIKKYRQCLVNYRQCIKDIIHDHRESFDPDNMRDYIDVYFKEMLLKQEHGIDTKLNEDNLEATIEDLFLAGAETTATSLRWTILLMMAYPDVQSRVQEELDSVVGRDRLPVLADRSQLIYTEAVINEIMRYGTIAPIGAPHFAENDTTFRGYDIPKGTIIIGNLWNVSRDPDLWNDPNIDQFNPDRFLDNNNEGGIQKPEHHLVFGSGRRACIGEQLGRMEVYIFFTHLLHQFRVKKPHETYHLNLRGKSGVVHAPLPYETLIEPRE